METLGSAVVDLAAGDLAEVDAAIALVSAGVAVRVRLVAFRRASAVAAVALARAQAAGVAFRVSADDTAATTLEFGPRTEPPPTTG